MTTAKDVGSIILLVLLSPLALIALLLGALFAIPVYIIGVIVAFARHDELSGWTRIKVALAWPLEFWLKLKTKKAFAFLGRQVGRLSGRLKKWNAGRIRRTDDQKSQESDVQEDVHNEPAEDADVEEEPEKDTNGDDESEVTDRKPRIQRPRRPRKAPALRKATNAHR